MAILRYYRQPGISPAACEKLLQTIRSTSAGSQVLGMKSEICIYAEITKSKKSLTLEEENRLEWIITTPFEKNCVSKDSFLSKHLSTNEIILEFGPRLNYSSSFSTNAVSICRSAGLNSVERVEHSTRYLIYLDPQLVGEGPLAVTQYCDRVLSPVLHDRMTHCQYRKPIETFELNITPEPVYEVNVLEEGRLALEQVNQDLGLAFDEYDIEYYTKLFRDEIGRNPTSVECFDLAQSNSEHCRHWFFRGILDIDGTQHDTSLLRMVMDSQKYSNPNNIIKFSDNSSAIEGYPVSVLRPVNPGGASHFEQTEDKRHIVFTAETHNFPTGVAPFPGATTGTGGRIRDVQATGRGAHVIAGTAGYSFGNLLIPGYKLPWEDSTLTYPSNFARPLDIAIEASNGASDYGNKFGEPILAGFARSFGQLLPGSGERREWIKPIMFTGGIGSISSSHVTKMEPDIGMEVVKVGGPVYRIGVGGGAASSVEVQGDNKSELDFGAVQRGDAEMEQKMNRVIRACIESVDNCICSIHDQGAGGNGNVLKELVSPAGAVIHVSEFQLGDPTLSVLEIWGAEYQESNALLVRSEHRSLLQSIAAREKCPVSFVGQITGTGKVCLEDDRSLSDGVQPDAKKMKRVGTGLPVDLDLQLVLGDMPRKVFKIERTTSPLLPISLPEGVQVRAILERVLRLPSVASKRYLTNKVDRSVTGLVAQQQCVGPLHTPLADVAVVALSPFDKVGAATAIGEQPIKGLVDACCGARMTVGEALTNLVFAPITTLRDVKCSGNWMWPAKLPGEGALLYDACRAMCDVMSKLGVAVDGGKDSLSMAARHGSEFVRAPGCLVVSVYSPCTDITAVVTPDLKCPHGKGSLLYVELAPGKHRLGGSALAQCYGQIGNSSPDLDSASYFTKAFAVTQQLIQDKLITAGHDVSDGGLITCLLEMAFAGNCGITANFEPLENVSATDLLFAEELGLILEVAVDHEQSVVSAYTAEGIVCKVIGWSSNVQEVPKLIQITVNGLTVLDDEMTSLRDVWEATSFQLARLQSNASCVEQEEKGLKLRIPPQYKLTFDTATIMSRNANQSDGLLKVAVIREEGSNGDREMVAALQMAGFEVWDVNMQDLSSGSVTLDQFRGIVFVGGFSYADVFGSAKGWAAALRFNDRIRRQFDDFCCRSDTFSLGVCNGCQLLALLGWVGSDEDNKENGDSQGVLVTHNESECFESRFVTVRIENSPSIMLTGMEGSVLGVWVAHGEGRVVFKNSEILESVHASKLVPLRYADDLGRPTSEYPMNPNGSVDGIAALCSADGRHLAMMPHPERCVLPWQWPWMPAAWRHSVDVSPWLCMFKNALDWCRSVDLQSSNMSSST